MTGARRFERDPAGFTVVVPEGASPPVPLCCPVCDTALRTRDDERSHSLYGCCSACESEWVHADVVAWRAGVRPAAQEVEAVVAARPGIAVRIERT